MCLVRHMFTPVTIESTFDETGEPPNMFTPLAQPAPIQHGVCRVDSALVPTALGWHFMPYHRALTRSEAPCVVAYRTKPDMWRRRWCWSTRIRSPRRPPASAASVLLESLGMRDLRAAPSYTAQQLALLSLGRTESALAAFAPAHERIEALFGAGDVESAHVEVEQMRALRPASSRGFP